MEDYPDDPERAEELEREPGELAPDAPEADALEQATPVDPTPDDDRADPVGDAPEADTLDQRRGVDEDLEERR